MSVIVLDMKIGLLIINEILVENRGNQVVVDACRLAYQELKKQIDTKGTNDYKANMEPTKEFMYMRTRTMLHLLSDVQRYSEQPDSSYIAKMAVLTDLIDKKIFDLRNNVERGVN